MKLREEGSASFKKIGQSAFDFAPMNGDNRDYPFTGNRAHPNDLQALCNYTQRFGYDSVGNLESFIHRARGEGWTRHYDYEETSLIESNKTNNRLTRTRIGDNFNQIENYTHDAHGNMISMPHLSAMTWDSEDRLHEINLGGGGTAYYVYDAAGQRVRKVIESQNGVRRKERFYLGGFELYREYEPNGQNVSLERESLHVMDDQRRIALVETQTIGNQNQTIRYQLGNHLGSASLELDENGELISYEEYHPYGTTAFQAGRTAAEVSLKRYRYTAKERDDESGLNYHGARYYAPWLARWTAPDPAEMVDGTNLFGYCRNNPVKLVDLDGKRSSRRVAPAGRPQLDPMLLGRIGQLHASLRDLNPNYRPSSTISPAGPRTNSHLRQEIHLLEQTLTNAIYQSGFRPMPEIDNSHLRLRAAPAPQQSRPQQPAESPQQLQPSQTQQAPLRIPYANDPRDRPGIASGGENLPIITGRWLLGSHGNAGQIPRQIADALRGQHFNNFGEFREAFWKAVANDPVLAQQFSSSNQRAMAGGRAPHPVEEQMSGQGPANRTYNLHHVERIEKGGAVYNMDNIWVVTPQFHGAQHGAQ
jgi:RHS repeat-associated protein